MFTFSEWFSLHKNETHFLLKKNFKIKPYLQPIIKKYIHREYTTGILTNVKKAEHIISLNGLGGYYG